MDYRTVFVLANPATIDALRPEWGGENVACSVGSLGDKQVYYCLISAEAVAALQSKTDPGGPVQYLAATYRGLMDTTPPEVWGAAVECTWTDAEGVEVRGKVRDLPSGVEMVAGYLWPLEFAGWEEAQGEGA